MPGKSSIMAKYYHAMNHIPELGPVRVRKLVCHFGSPAVFWKAPVKELALVEGFTQKLAGQVAGERNKIDPERCWEDLLQKGIAVVSIEDPGYPPLLKEIYDPPVLLYYNGEIETVHGFCLAIVGSRRHTVYGRETAYKIAAKLSNYNLAIVSGMARGIDTWAHKGALDSGGKTAAVLGCGLDICYPAENRKLKDAIAGGGVVISEFPPGFKPLPQNFPRRNRIISGLSLGTLVIEAAENSGALITAGFALEQGREVFAVPGAIGSPYSRGCHRLIKEGAKLVENLDDILEEIRFCGPEKAGPAGGGCTESAKEGLSAAEKKLLGLVTYEPVDIEVIAQLSRVPLSKLNALLLELELKGAVKRLAGNYFMRI